MKIIIDPGHGGKDNGGGTNQYWKEKDKNLEISLYQYDRFKKLGIDVDITRTEDITLEAKERTDIVKNSNADICVSNHINNVLDPRPWGAETIHSIFTDGKLARMIMDGLLKEGARKRRVFSIESKRWPGKDYYYMHRLTGPVETIIVEYGFASNPEDTKKILENWKQYAEAVIRALCEYIDHPYTTPVKEVETVEEVKEKTEIEKATDWVKANYISDGTRGKEYATRAEVFVMLYRALGGGR